MSPRPNLSLRRIVVRVIDGAVLLAAYVASFYLRFDLHPDPGTWAMCLSAAPWVLIAYMLSFELCGVYRGLVYFSSFDDFLLIAQGTGLAAFTTAAIILFTRQGQFPRSVLLLQPVLAFVGISAVRAAIRLGKTRLHLPHRYGGKTRNVVLVGAGELGESVLRQMRKSADPHYHVVGFLDDDSTTWGMSLHGRPVLGGRDALRSVLERWQVDEIVIAITAQRGQIVRAIIESIRDVEPRPELRIAPSLDEMLRNTPSGVGLRKVNPADLLNRGVIKSDSARIGSFVRGKVVLITGAGGTIGAELCRQVLEYEPAKVVMVENHATSLFYSEARLRERPPRAGLVALLADIRDQALVNRIFEEHKPQIVLHAAAHKHVSQLEQNVCEGIANNVLATYYLACAARDHKAEAFLLVSTDKAVRPSSVMGATKRAAELIVKTLASRGGSTRFLAVRFGNVLGSSGSVLEIFQLQIARGGPITVTHEEVTRYFMTVEEAVNLILQAAAISMGGEIFVLKMGAAVKIIDMAKSLVLLSGLEPGRDIEIRVTGLKPGEKMHEELMEDPAGHDSSTHPDIMVLRSENKPLENLEDSILDLELATRKAPVTTLVQKLKALAPTFSPDSAHGLTSPQTEQREGA